LKEDLIMTDFNNDSTSPDVKVSGIINAPVDQVWATVGEFNGFPSVLPDIWDTSTQFNKFDGEKGTFRELANNEGGNIVEKLEAIDCEGSNRSIEFSILGGSFANILPVDFETYDAKIQLKSIGGNKTRFTWTASYDVKEGITENDARSVFQGIFNTALESLRTIHEPQSTAGCRPDIDLSPLENPDAGISVIIDAPLDAVWATVGNFNALPHYLPRLWDTSELDLSGADSRGVGAVRTLTSALGSDNESQIVEKLLAYDGLGDVRSLKFDIDQQPVNFPLPFEFDTYEAFMQVKEVCGDRSRFTWSASYDPLIPPHQAANALEGLFQEAADNLKLIHEQPDIFTGARGCSCALEACNDFGEIDSPIMSGSDMSLPVATSTPYNQPISAAENCGPISPILGVDTGLKECPNLGSLEPSPLDVCSMGLNCNSSGLWA
jgi:uncharacterized membrane protein